MEESQPESARLSSRTGNPLTRELLGDRIRAAISFSPLNQSEVAKEARMGQNTLSNYVNGKRVPDALTLARLARVLEFDPGAILSEKRFNPDPVRTSRERESGEPTVRVPIYSARLGASGAGAGGEPTDEIISYGDVWTGWLREQARVNPARAFIATVYGSSMLRLYANGDLVVGEAMEDIATYRDDTYALWLDDELLIKHVRRQRDGLDLISENASFPPVQLRGAELDPDRFRLIGRVAGKVTGHIV